MEFDVFVQHFGTDYHVGRIWTQQRRGANSATFEYRPEFLQLPWAYALGPDLGLFSGPQQSSNGRPTFGAISDTAPDRWGRGLLRRFEKVEAESEGRRPRTLSEMDYVIGVSDELRQGALRFAPIGSNDFLSPVEQGIPHLITLPRLLNAAERVDQEIEDDTELGLLVHAGGSLGGARPKAAVVNRRGALCIAKFPRARTDSWDVMAWEKLTLDLARDVGISVPASDLIRVSNRSVLVLERFDRTTQGRVEYASAMTLLDARDGEQASYLDIAGVIEESSSNATADLRELWTRIVFSVFVSNTDDHLRNHGFLRRSSGGWSLAPAFDINPDPEGPKALSTAISEDDNTASIGLALSVAPYFRLSSDEAEQIVEGLRERISSWPIRARTIGIAEREIALMQDAFRLQPL